MSLLPIEVSTSVADDLRIPVDDKVLPVRIYHVNNSRGGDSAENWIVEYANPMLCRDGKERRKIFYQCCRKGTADDSEERKAGHAEAERKAWRHVESIIASMGPDAEPAAARRGPTRRMDGWCSAELAWSRR